MADPIKDTEAKMKKAIEVLKQRYAAVRTGRATPALVEHLQVEYYGSKVPLRQIASISVPEPRTISIQPFDKTAAKEIERAISASDLGVTPKNDGGIVRLNLPQLNEERRKELVKVVKKEAEEAKVVIRNLRREGIEGLKALKEAEDLTKKKEEDIQKMTDRESAETDKLLALKEKEIMEV